MSMAGFRIRNHPQQVRRRGAIAAVDERCTPRRLFLLFDAEYGPFTIDVASSSGNARCARFFTPEMDGLRQPWSGRVWCNPPYSDIPRWVVKAWEEVVAGRCERVAMLLPADRTEQPWWQRHVEPYREGRLWRNGVRLTTRFLAGRINFGMSGRRWRSSAPFGCVLVIWDRL